MFKNIEPTFKKNDYVRNYEIAGCEIYPYHFDIRRELLKEIEDDIEGTKRDEPN